jgi:hypothetical protein
MNQTEFAELLPFYANGTLDAADRTAVLRYLDAHPQARDEARWLRSVQDTLRAEAVPASSEVGLARVLHRIRADRAKPVPARPRLWRTLLQRLLSPPLLKPMAAGAMAVLALQGVLLGALVEPRDGETSATRMVPMPMTDPGPFVKINFKPDAQESDIRMLLIEVQATLAAGPGQLGDYYLRVAEPRIAEATSRLAASPIVDGVAVVDALPGSQP